MSYPPPGPHDPGPAGGPWASDRLPPHPMASAPPPEVEQPPSIRTAVRLMFVGAALSVLSVLVSFTQTDAMREAIEDSDSSLTASEVDAVVSVVVAFGVVFGLVGVGLWIWMAIANGRGKSWARVVATVFAGLNVAGTLFSLAGGGAIGASVALGLVSAVLAAVILVLLYRPESSRFYDLRSRAGW